MVKVARKLDRAAACLEYFTTHEWSFNSSNVQSLWGLLSEHDKQVRDKQLHDIQMPFLQCFHQNHILPILFTPE